MKCILSGVWLHKYLAFEVLFAKYFGMAKISSVNWLILSGVIMVNGSGAILGKEGSLNNFSILLLGPFVHIASIVEDQCSKRIGLLKKLRMNPGTR